MRTDDQLAQLYRAVTELEAAARTMRAAIETMAAGRVDREAANDDDPVEAEDDGALLDLVAASERFNVPTDRLRRWCRECGIGRKRGGRWQVDPRLLRQMLGR